MLLTQVNETDGRVASVVGERGHGCCDTGRNGSICAQLKAFSLLPCDFCSGRRNEDENENV